LSNNDYIKTMNEISGRELPRSGSASQFGETFATSRQIGGDHYKQMAIQPAEFIHRNGLGFLEGCVIKRVCRYRGKDGKQDLLKAIHELQLLIELEYPENA
jgi:hypothetical protein